MKATAGTGSDNFLIVISDFYDYFSKRNLPSLNHFILKQPKQSSPSQWLILSDIVKHQCLFLCFSLISTYASAQSSAKIEGLRTQLSKSMDDTTRINVLIDLGSAFIRNNPDTAELIAHQVLDISGNLNYTRGSARAITLLGNIYRLKGEMKEAEKYYKKAINLYTRSPYLKDLAITLNNYGIALEAERKYKEAFIHYDSALRVFTSIQDTAWMADTYLNLAIFYWYQSNFKESFLSYNQSLELFELAGDSNSIAMVHANLSIIQKYLGNYELAIDNLYKALPVFESNNDLLSVSQCYLNIGAVYSELSEYTKSKKNTQLALKILEKSGYKEEIMKARHNLGVNYADLKDLDSAFYCFRESHNLAKELNNMKTIGMTYNSLGLLYLEGKDYDSALYFFNLSIDVKEELGDKRGLSLSYSTLGQLHEKKNKYLLAERSFNKSIHLLSEIDAIDIAQEIYFAIYNFYKNTGDEKQALQYLEKYNTAKDSTISEEKSRRIMAAEVRHETVKKEQEIKLNKSRIEKQQAVIKRQATQRNLMVVGIISLIMIALLLIYNYRTKLKARKLVDQESKKFEKMRTKFFANISHEFRTPLTLISGPVKNMLNSETLPSKDVEDLKMVNRNTNQLEQLISQLLDMSKLEAGKLKLIPEQVEVFRFIKTITSSFSPLAEQKSIQFDVNIPDDSAFVLLDSQKLEIIVNNLLTNAFKFTPDKGIVGLSIVFDEGETGSLLKLKIEDSGNGLSAKEIGGIFDHFYQNKKAISDEVIGIGLSMTNELVNLMGGSIDVESQKGAGSSFSVVLPVTVLEGEGSAHQAMPEPIEPHNFDYLQEVLPAPNDTSNSLPIILIAEDNTDLRNFIKNCMGNDYQYITAKNGQEGLALAIKEVPDVIISDVMMPVMDGIQFCKEVKQIENTAHIPFIMLTAKATRDSKLEGLESGADDYIFKPFEAKELILKTKNLLAKRKILQEKLIHELIFEPKSTDLLSEDDRFIYTLKSIVEHHLKEPDLRTDFLSRESGIDREQLNRRVKSLTGLPISSFVSVIRLKKAAQLLDQNWGSVSEIAYAVGFNNLSYFAKCFRNAYGKTPSEYQSVGAVSH